MATLPVTVHELLWHSGGRSFDVHRVDTGEDRTEAGCFDTMPADGRIADLSVHHVPACDWSTAPATPSATFGE